MSLVDAARKIVSPIEHRVRATAARCVLNLIDDSLGMQGVQITALARETIPNPERMQNYGFTSKPFPGCEGAVIFLQGDRGSGIVIACDDRRYRLVGLEDGEVALYDDLGHKVWLKRTGIMLDGGGHNITVVNAPQLINQGGDVLADGISLKGHKHGGVQPGAGESDVPVAP